MEDDFDYDDILNDEDEYEEDECDNEEDSGLSDYDIEMAGAMDGEQEGNLGMAEYSNYGSGIDLDELTDEQRDLYDNAYHSSRN